MGYRHNIRRVSCLLCVFTLSFASWLYAAPTYGPDMPKRGKITMGYQSNIVFKHRLDDSYGKIESTQHFLDLSYGVYDWFSFDGKLGVGDITHEGASFQKVGYGYSFAGGYGFRIRLMDSAKYKAKAALGFHHISVNPQDKVINSDKYESFLDDWQADLTISKNFRKVDPFIGIKASKFDMVYNINHGGRKRTPPKYWTGVVAGCDLNLREDISIKVEGHFIDETSFSSGIYYKY